jgi:DNA polymerase III epsilon subunit family exonuclease
MALKRGLRALVPFARKSDAMRAGRRQLQGGRINGYSSCGENQRMAVTRRAKPATATRPVAGADDAKFVFFDLETTGLSPRGCRIIEIGALRVASGGVACASFHALIRIDEPVPYFITRLTGITDEMLIEGDPIENAFPRFCNFVEELPLVAYNVNFDMGFLRTEAARQKIKLRNKPVCALSVARRKLPELPNHKLMTVARHLGIERGQTHRALDDCEMGLRVFSELTRV